MMRFHHVHGRKITLASDGRRAVKSEDTFCDGIAFSARPLDVGEAYSLLLECRDKSDWSGTLRVGVTRRDPGELEGRALPKHACPELSSRDGYWVKKVKDSLIRPGTNRITFCLTSKRKFLVSVNGRTSTSHLDDDDDEGGGGGSTKPEEKQLPIEKNLWAVFDVYGNSHSLEFFREDDIPVEILARGRHAAAAYSEALAASHVTVNRGRIFFVGHERAGKTSLINALVGDSSGSAQQPTEGLECSRRDVRIHRDGKFLVHEGSALGEVGSDSDGQNSHLSLEVEKRHSVASTVASSILKKSKMFRRQPRRKSDPSPSKRNNRRKRSTKAVKGNQIEPTPSTSTNNSERSSIPDNMLPLVEKYLSAKKRKPRKRSKRSPTESMSVEDAESETEVEEDDDEDSLDPVITAQLWDFGGHPDLHAAHQTLLGGGGDSDALFVLAFDLRLELDSRATESVWDAGKKRLLADNDMTNLETVALWLHMIADHCGSGSSDRVVIVGTHSDSIHSDPTMQASLANLKFERILERVRGSKALEALVTHPFFLANASKPCQCSNEPAADAAVIAAAAAGMPAEPSACSFCSLRRRIYHLLLRQPSVGRSVPKTWTSLDRTLLALRKKNVCFANANEIYRHPSVAFPEEELEAALKFYHAQGFLLYLSQSAGGPRDDDFENGGGCEAMIVIEVEKVAKLISRLVSPYFYAKMLHDNALAGVKAGPSTKVPGDVFSKICQISSVPESEAAVILSSLDCAIRSGSGSPLIVPILSSSTKGKTTAEEEDRRKVFDSDSALSIVFNFTPFLPECLFYMTTVALIKLYDAKPEAMAEDISDDDLDHEGKADGDDNSAKFAFERRSLIVHLAHDHVLRLVLEPARHNRISLAVAREPKTSRNENNKFPSQQICQQTLIDIESCLGRLMAARFPRVHFETAVPCECRGKTCQMHKARGCRRDPGCLHFLPLGSVLSNRTVMCDFRKVNTKRYQQFFPLDSISGEVTTVESLYVDNPLLRSPPSAVFPIESLAADKLLSTTIVTRVHGKQLQPHNSPKWVRGAAKLLDAGFDGEDWKALAELLGYRNKKMEQFEDTLEPSLALFRDWLSSSGSNTKLSVEMLTACLEEIKRHDVVEVIVDAEAEEEDFDAPAPPQVFISYHWDSQEEVLLLRAEIERRSGLSCWMDVGQMGGGDYLYNQIYRGISQCRVVVACVTPRYVVSDSCCKEVSLSDLLRKPVIPVVMERTPWPPPGAMGVIFSPLIYVDLAGCGGHGGRGRGADWKEKVHDLASRLLSYSSSTSSAGGRSSQQRMRTATAASTRKKTARTSSIAAAASAGADFGEVVADVGTRGDNSEEEEEEDDDDDESSDRRGDRSETESTASLRNVSVSSSSSRRGKICCGRCCRPCCTCAACVIL